MDSGSNKNYPLTHQTHLQSRVPHHERRYKMKITTYILAAVIGFMFTAVQICGCKQKTTRRMVDPGPQFREAFEGINRIEFLTRDRGCFCLGHGIAAVDNREIIQRFFEILDFVPYEEGSSEHCDWECDEIVRTYSNYDQDDEFTIHHRNHDTIVRWHHQETDLKLTAESAAALKSYLADYAYAPAKHEMENKQAPLPRMLPPPTIPTSPTKTY